MRPLRNNRATAAAAIALELVAFAARADDGAVPQRPPIMFNRWQEDWSALADPRVPRQPLDELKYIALSAVDPKTYLSLGADVRERFEANDAQGFGTGSNRSQDYVISRTEWHADLRIASQVQVFTQLQSDFAPWKTMLSPVDQDRLDLEQAFVALTEPVEGGTLKLRLGRQQFAFDLQRFVSVRDGPNVRQSYDAAWGDYENGPWRIITFYSRPVQVRDDRAFDDYGSDRQTFGGVRLERKLSATVNVNAYYAQFTQANVRFPNAGGDERRSILDVRLAGGSSGFDFDIEAMGQGGRIGEEAIRAWALGSLAGYTLGALPWTPRLGLQVDAASGDRNTPGHFGTFNPLFPNGYYVTLAGFTGYVNFVHVKPSLTLHVDPSLKLTAAVAAQWREATADAVYAQPDIAVANTAGRPGIYTGSYGQLRLDWSVDRATSVALEVVHFVIGDALRSTGAHDSSYLGAEVKYGW